MLEAIHRPLAGRLMKPQVSHLVTPSRCELQVVLEAGQFLSTSSQGIVLDVAHGSLDDSLRFRVAAFAGNGLQTVVAAEGQELGMEAGGAAEPLSTAAFKLSKTTARGLPPKNA